MYQACQAKKVALEFGDSSGVLYDLGVHHLLNTYVHLGLAADFSTGTVYGFLNGIQAPDTGPTGGATDFHDFDLFVGDVSNGGGTRDRAGSRACRGRQSDSSCPVSGC